jgi:outer membrane immunogenic protein
MSTRALIVAVALCGAMVASTEAADQSAASGRAPSYYPNSYYPTAILWSGFYTGLHIGGVESSATWTDPLPGAASDNPRPGSILGGAQIGVNWQWDWLVLGAEADMSWLRLHGFAVDSAGFNHTISAHWLSMATGRLGYAFNRYLAYAKGGAAFTGERNDVSTPAGKTASTGTLTQVGWTVGGGVEYAFDSAWSARLEYDFIDFPSQDLTLHGFGLPTVPVTVDWRIQKLVGAINFRF